MSLKQKFSFSTKTNPRMAKLTWYYFAKPFLCIEAKDPDQEPCTLRFWAFVLEVEIIFDEFLFGKC